MQAGTIDIMISSPPYFNLEIFEDTKAQSINKFRNLSMWVDKFLIVCMHKIIKLLRVGGYMIINIDNPRDLYMDYITPMLRFSNSKAKYIGLITIMKTHLTYSFWVWKKIE